MGDKLDIHSEFQLLTEEGGQAEHERSNEELARLKDQVKCLQVLSCHPCSAMHVDIVGESNQLCRVCNGAPWTSAMQYHRLFHTIVLVGMYSAVGQCIVVLVVPSSASRHN